MTNQTDSTNPARLFEESVGYLSESLNLVVRSQERVGIRVRILIRAVMVGLVITLSSFFFLIYLLTDQVDALSDTLDMITNEAIEMRSSIDNIQIVMMSFENQMEVMPILNHSVGKITTDIDTIGNGMHDIAGNVQSMSIELTELQGAMSGLSGKITGLDQTLFRVEKDMSDSTKPMRRFNQINPLNIMR